VIRDIAVIEHNHDRNLILNEKVNQQYNWQYEYCAKYNQICYCDKALMVYYGANKDSVRDLEQAQPYDPTKQFNCSTKNFPEMG
jgi:hypothetical protein